MSRARALPARLPALVLAALLAACAPAPDPGPTSASVRSGASGAAPESGAPARGAGRVPLARGASPPVVAGLVVADETGESIPGAEVRVAAAGGREGLVATTDRFGRFAFDRSPAGPGEPLRLEVRARNFALLRQHFVRGTRPVCRLVVGGCVRGRVGGARGEPIGAAEVLLLRAWPGEERPVPDVARVAHRAISGSDGTYAIENVCAGEYVLATYAEGPPPRRQEPLSGVRVSVEEGSVVRVDLLLAAEP